MRADLEHRLDFVVREHRAEMQRALSQLKGDLFHRGMAGGSGAMISKERLAAELFDGGFARLTADVDKAAVAGVAREDRETCLRDSVGRLLVAIREVFKEPAADAFGPTYGVREEKFTEFEGRAASLVRQYFAGYLTAHNSPERGLTLSINDSPGAVVQQGGAGNVQSATVWVNVAAAGPSLASLLEELKKLPPDTPMVREAIEDAETVQRQLARPDPSSGLLRELGKSLRNIVEGTIAGVLSTEGLAAAGHLWPALGLS
jgi:hypothetical protein